MKKYIIIGVIIVIVIFLIRKFTAPKESDEILEPIEPEGEKGLNVKELLKSQKIDATRLPKGLQAKLDLENNPNLKSVQDWQKVLKPNWRETNSIYGFSLEEDERSEYNENGDLFIKENLLNNKEKAQVLVNVNDMKGATGGTRPGGTRPGR